MVIKQRMIKFKPWIKLNYNISRLVQFIVLFQQQLNCNSFKQSAVSKVEFMSLLEITPGSDLGNFFNN